MIRLPRFWGEGFESFRSLAEARQPDDVVRVLENFALLRRRHVYTLSCLKGAVLPTAAYHSRSTYSSKRRLRKQST